jgi:toxin ParE1/3/4
LDNIVHYAVAAHGLEKARAYVAGLRDFVAELGLGPRGQRIEGLDPTLLRAKFRSHFIFFRVIGDTLLVSRIMHERRDFRRHLS